MTIRLIEVPACGEIPLEAQLNGALGIARKLGAHLRVTYVATDPALQAALLAPSAVVTRSLIDELEKSARDRKRERKEEFEAWCRENGIGHEPVEHRLASTFAVWEEKVGTIEEVVMQRGRLSDLIVIKRPEPADVAASECFDAAVFSSGRPTLLAPDKPVFNPFEHVVVAWNGSLEVTHAVSQCVDVLHAADRVSIFSAPAHGDGARPELDLSESLRWHGIGCSQLHPRPHAGSVGAGLLQAAHDAGASLIIMGAFTHSRVREMLLGGVTRHVLRHCTLPVLMAH